MSSKIRATVLSFILSLCLPFGAFSALHNQDWKPLGANKSGDRTFYNPGSVMQLSADSFRVDLKVLRANGSASEIQEEVDCAHKVARDLMVTESKKGQAVPPANKASGWRPMELDPDLNELYKNVCRGIPRR